MAALQDLTSVVRSLREQTVVTALASGKGGVGKTSLAANMAGLMSGAGYRVLLVSQDPQDDLGDDLGYDQEVDGDGGAVLAAALLGEGQLAPTLLDSRPDLDVVTGGSHVAAAYHRIIRESRDAEGLARALTDVAADYDYIFLDVPPHNETAQALAFRAARWIIVPTRSDRSSKRGIAHLARDFVAARQDNPDLRLLGIVGFGVGAASTDLRARMRQELEVELGEVVPMLQTTIRHAEAAAEAARQRGLLMHELAETRHASWREAIKNRSARIPANSADVAAEYMSLTKEVITRMLEEEKTQ